MTNEHATAQLEIPKLERYYESHTALSDSFEAFHVANVSVYNLIVLIARELKVAGFKSCGIALIFERMRWLYALQTQGDAYKLNNNFRAFYARRIMERETDLAGFFNVRVQKSETNNEG